MSGVTKPATGASVDAARLAGVSAPTYDTDRVWTVPNVISFARLLGVPLFLWLVLGPHADGWAVVLLAVAGLTDFLDGKLARAWHQVSRLGQMLDPVADRLYILAIIIGLALRQFIPWWLVAVLVARDVMLACLVPVLRSRGFTSLPVHFLGKTATFLLLYAFPLVLLASVGGTVGDVCRVVGWAFALWGAGMYWWAGVLYVVQAIRLVRSRPAIDPARRPGHRPDGEIPGSPAPKGRV